VMSAIDESRGLDAEFLAVDLPAMTAQHGEEVTVAATEFENSPLPWREARFQPRTPMGKGGIPELLLELSGCRIGRGIVAAPIEQIEPVLGDTIVETMHRTTAACHIPPSADRPDQTPFPRSADATLRGLFPQRGRGSGVRFNHCGAFQAPASQTS